MSIHDQESTKYTLPHTHTPKDPHLPTTSAHGRGYGFHGLSPYRPGLASQACGRGILGFEENDFDSSSIKVSSVSCDRFSDELSANSRKSRGPECEFQNSRESIRISHSLLNSRRLEGVEIRSICHTHMCTHTKHNDMCTVPKTCTHMKTQPHMT